MQFARALLVLGMFSLAACGSDSLGDQCKDACDNPCPGETVSDVTACKADCDQLQKDLEQTGCEDKFNAVSDCSGDSNSCETNTSTDCNDEALAFASCVSAYCEANPTASACTN